MILCGCGSEMELIGDVKVRVKGQYGECYRGKLYACKNVKCSNFVIVVEEIVEDCDDVYIDYNVDRISVVRVDKG